jgi:hypothetical protein
MSFLICACVLWEYFLYIVKIIVLAAVKKKLSSCVCLLPHPIPVDFELLEKRECLDHF